MASNQYDLEIVIRTKKQGDGLEQVNKTLGETRTQMNQTSQGVQAGGLKWTEFASKLSVAKVAFGVVAGAAKVAYDQIDKGAQLQAAEKKFANLAVTIGTTGDALLGKLGAATKGMVSDAELIAGASDIISLGLAKNEGDTVRLATAVSTLGLDMQQVILTFANNSKARLDSLGLSVEGVTAKAAELEAQGFTGDAFDEAVLLGLEDKMTLFGDAAETTAGQLQILESNWKNLTDRFKQGAAEIAGPVVSGIVSNMTALDALQTAYENGIITQREYTRGRSNISSGREEIEVLKELGLTIDGVTTAQEASIARSTAMGEFYQAEANSIKNTGDALRDVNRAMLEFGGSLGPTTQELEDQAYATGELAGHDEALANAIEQVRARTEAAAAAQANYTQAFRDASGPTDDLLQAQADLAASQGEWVTRTVSTAGQVSAINQQLAADLSNEQKGAYQEILRTVDEGSAEWLAAYNALQNDLTDSQRQALVAQQADLANRPDVLANVYTGDAEAAEDAQARIDAANAAIAQSYRETAAEAILAQGGITQANLDLLVGIGYLTQAQADARLEFANTTTAIEELTASAEFNRLTTEEQTAALNSLIEGTANTAAEAVNLAEQQTAVNDALNAMPEAVVSTVTIRDPDEAGSRLGDLLRQLDSLDGRNVSASATVNTFTNSDIGSGGGVKEPQKLAAGGSVFAGGIIQAGEKNLPELLRQKDGRLFVIPGDDGQVFSNSQSMGMLGGQTINDNRQTIINANTKEAAALALASAQVTKRARFNRSMGV